MGIKYVISFLFIKKRLKTHTNLLTKTWLNFTFVAVARDSAPLPAYKKILCLIGLKNAISFLFGKKSKTHKDLLREKCKLFGGDVRGRAQGGTQI